MQRTSSLTCRPARRRPTASLRLSDWPPRTMVSAWQCIPALSCLYCGARSLLFSLYYTAVLTHLAASNSNEIWAIVSESGIPAAVQPVAAAPAAPAVPTAPAGKVGKGGRNTRAAANAPKTKTPAAVPVAPAPSEIVFESGGMTPACGRVQALVEDLIDRFPHTVPPIASSVVLKGPAADNVSAPCCLNTMLYTN